jgi:transcriptional regulator with XRE-family HTH domain
MTPQYTLRRSKPARFPNAIRRYRLQAGLTQKKLAELVGRSRGVISSWERGTILPSVPNLFKLAKILNTLAESLYAEFYFPKESRLTQPQGA